MDFKVVITPRAKRKLGKLNSVDKKRVKKRINELSNNPELGQRVVNYPLWKTRVGKIRIIYRIVYDEVIVEVINIGYRTRVYRHF